VRARVRLQPDPVRPAPRLTRLGRLPPLRESLGHLYETAIELLGYRTHDERCDLVPGCGVPTPAQGRAFHQGAQGRSQRSAATELVERFTDLWRNILTGVDVDVDTDFFRAGGQSLAAVELAQLVSELVGQRTPLMTIFHAPTSRLLVTELRCTNLL
jgi:hypothetical protein